MSKRKKKLLKITTFYFASKGATARLDCTLHKLVV